MSTATSSSPLTKPFQIDTTKGAALRLSEFLAAGGWTSGDKATLQAYRGAAIADDLEMVLAPPARQIVMAEGEDTNTWNRRALKHQDSMKAWGQEPFQFEITEAERDVCRICVKKVAADGRMQLDRVSRQLLKALGLDQE